jgi:hypothetical protein
MDLHRDVAVVSIAVELLKYIHLNQHCPSMALDHHIRLRRSQSPVAQNIRLKMKMPL